MSFLIVIYEKLGSLNNLQDTSIDPNVFLRNEVSWLLHKAILCGEHYDTFTVGKIENQLNDLQLTLIPLIAKKDKSTWKGLNPDEVKNLLNIVNKRYFVVFKELSNLVTSNLENFLKGKKIEGINVRKFQDFYWRRDLKEILQSISSTETIMFEDVIFRINILLAYLDEYLECNEDTLKELDQIEFFLLQEEALLTNEVIKILLDKVRFYKFKINYRYNHPHDTFEDNLKDYAEVLKTNCYYEFYTKAIDHYAPINSNQAKSWKVIIKKLNDQPIEEFRLEPFHHLRKYLYKTKDKGLVKSKEASEKLLEVINKKFAALEGSFTSTPEQLFNFDKVSLQTGKHLLANSIYGMELKIEKKLNFVNIKRSIENYISGNTSESTPDNEFLSLYYAKLIKFSSNKENIPDYYCFVTFLEFLNDMIKNLKTDPYAIIELSEKKKDEPSLATKKRLISKMIVYLEAIYKKTLEALKINLEKIIPYKALPIYLTWQECQIPYKWENDHKDSRKLFLRSSYILPIDYSRVISQTAAWDNLINAQQHSLKDTFDVAIAHYDILTQIKDFDKKVKENEFKLVQIVAMFVSIATFVLINVKIFDGKTGLESFGIIIGLAGCFVLFNLFFYIIVIAQYKSARKVWLVIARFAAFLILPIGLCIASYYILSDQQNQTHERENVLYRFLTDSTNKANEIEMLKSRNTSDSFMIKKLDDKIYNR